MNFLLLTSDATLLRVIQSSFSAAAVRLQLRTDAASAIELVARCRLDGFVIDCDDVSGGPDVLAKIRSSRSSKQSVVVAVVNGTTTGSTAVEAGADFVLGKPVQDRQLRSFLDVALPRMEREHRRYFRHKVGLRLKLVYDKGETLTGKIINVSEGRACFDLFWACPDQGRDNCAIWASQRTATKLPGEGTSSLECRSCYGLTLRQYRALVSFMVRSLDGFSSSAAAISKVCTIEQHTTSTQILAITGPTLLGEGPDYAAFLNSSNSANNPRMRSRLVSHSAITVCACFARPAVFAN